MRTIVIGDVHGCITEFRELVDRLKPRVEDRVICVGDFLDRGPEPEACVRFARDQGFESVLGNHEVNYLTKRHGYPKTTVLGDSDADWLRGLPTYLTFDPNFVVVHGGLVPGVPLEDQSTYRILRLRYLDSEGNPVRRDRNSLSPVPEGWSFWTSRYKGPYNVVYGHHPHSLTDPAVEVCSDSVRCYGIDTGCVFGGRLTAMVVKGHEVTFTQVPAKEAYYGSTWPIPKRRS